MNEALASPSRDHSWNRRELVRRLVLDSICNDYENVDQIILGEVAAQGSKCGLTIERSEIVDALASLIGDGLAKGYLLSHVVIELHGMPAIDTLEDDFQTYFYITKEGKELQLSDDKWWPFDDEGNLRPDWHLDLA